MYLIHKNLDRCFSKHTKQILCSGITWGAFLTSCPGEFCTYYHSRTTAPDNVGISPGGESPGEDRFVEVHGSLEGGRGLSRIV